MNSQCQCGNPSDKRITHNEESCQIKVPQPTRDMTDDQMKKHLLGQNVGLRWVLKLVEEIGADKFPPMFYQKVCDHKHEINELLKPLKAKTDTP